MSCDLNLITDFCSSTHAFEHLILEMQISCWLKLEAALLLSFLIGLCGVMSDVKKHYPTRNGDTIGPR